MYKIELMRKIEMDSEVTISAFNLDSLRTWYYNAELPFPHLTENPSEATRISDFDTIIEAAEHMGNYGKVKMNWEKI